MKAQTGFEAVYAGLLRLYPPRFRAQFAQEMQAVLACRLSDARPFGWRAWIKTVLSELLDYPASLYRAYGSEWTEAAMQTTAAIEIPWKQAALAGLPPLLVGIMNGLPVLVGLLGATLPMVQMNTGAFIGIIDIIFGVLILVFLGLAWRTGWPRWSASLYGLGVAVILVALTPLVYLLTRQQVNLWQQIELFLVGPIALALVLYLAARREPVRGLLTGLPAILILWNFILEFTAPGARAFVGVVAWLAAALVSAWIARHGNARQGALLALGVAVGSGLLYSLARTYFIHPDDTPYVQVGNLAEMAERWLIPLLAVSAVLVGPALLNGLRRQAQAAGRVWAFRLAFVGVLVELAGTLGAHLGIQLDLFRLFPGADSAMIWLSYLGGALFLVGVVLILTAKQAPTPWQERVNQWLSAAILFLTPVAVTLPLAHGYLPGTRALPYGLTWLIQLPIGLLLILAVVWVMAGGWAMDWHIRAVTPTPNPSPVLVEGEEI